MSLDPDIIEISSDDTADFDDASYGPSTEPSELVDGETSESDDVMGVDNLSPPSAVQNRDTELPSPKADDFLDDSDEDCVIVEDKSNNQAPAFGDLIDGGDEVDDLLIVQEKGENACRDYPHARNLCAKFPFSTTPHEKHCDRCHCYLCESPAPCIKWGNGFSEDDHCHASYRDKRWRVQKLLSKERRIKPPDLQRRRDITPSSEESTGKPYPQSHQDPRLLPAQAITSTYVPSSLTSNPNPKSLQDPILRPSQASATSQIPDSPTATVRPLSFKEKLYKELPFAYSCRRRIPKQPSLENPSKGPKAELLIPSIEDVKRKMHSGEESSSDDVHSLWSSKRAKSMRSSSNKHE